MHRKDRRWPWIRSALSRKLDAIAALETLQVEADYRRKLEQLAKTPAVCAEVECWWNASQFFDQDSSSELSFSEYHYFHNSLVRAIFPSLAGAAQQRALMTDWQRDSKGDDSVDKDEFFTSIVELAVTWCEVGEGVFLQPNECASYLNGLFSQIFSDKPDQHKLQWQERPNTKRSEGPTAAAASVDSTVQNADFSSLAALAKKDKLGAAFFSMQGMLRIKKLGMKEGGGMKEESASNQQSAARGSNQESMQLVPASKNGHRDHGQPQLSSMQPNIGIWAHTVETTPSDAFLNIEGEKGFEEADYSMESGMQSTSQAECMREATHWHAGGSAPMLPPLQTGRKTQQQSQSQQSLRKQSRRKKKKRSGVERPGKSYQSYWKSASKPAGIQVVRLSPIKLAPLNIRNDMLRKTPFVRLLEQQEHEYKRTGHLVPVNKPTRVADAIWATEETRRRRRVGGR
jgi:hypothetical protein